jgi:putative exporter of polyketide antibiotics
MTVAYLWILFIAGVAIQIAAVTVSIKAIGPLGLMLSGMMIIGAVMVSLAVAWGIIGEIATKL